MEALRLPGALAATVECRILSNPFRSLLVLVVTGIVLVGGGILLASRHSGSRASLSSRPGTPSVRDVIEDADTLTADMRRFVYARQGGEPDPSASEATRAAYARQTLALYAATFGPRMRAVREAFRAHKLSDPELDRYVERVRTPAEIAAACARLEALARALRYELR